MGLFSWITGRRADSGMDRSPWGDYWFQSIGMGSLSGIRISQDSAMQHSAVFRSVDLVSGHMAMFPVRFYKAGTRKRITKHNVLTLLNKRPNRWQNAFEWRQMVQGHLELRGNAYNEIIANSRGEIVELLPRHPDRVKIDLMDSGDYRYLVTDQNGTQRPVPRGSMWHLRGLSSNGITGLSRIEYARESIALGLAAQGYGARFFQNDARPPYWIEFPGQFKDKEARSNFRENVQGAHAGPNRGKAMVLDSGMKYHEIGLTNADAQFIETRKASVSDIARWFGVPPHKIGDLDKATFSNIEQQALEYIQDALQPRAASWEASITAELLFDDEEIDIEFDFRALMRGDSTQRATYMHNGIQDGWLTRNEARDMEGMEPLPGLDEPLRPLNMVEEDEAEDQEDDLEQSEPPAQEAQEPKEDGETAMRLHALLEGNARRLAYKFSKSGKADADLLVEALACDAKFAREWCENNFPGMTNEQEIMQSLLKLGAIK